MTKNYLPCNHTSLNDRIKMLSKYFGRARKRSMSSFTQALFSTNAWQQLLPSPPLDGLALYRHALTRLTLPPQLNRPGGKIIMLVSRVN